MPTATPQPSALDPGAVVIPTPREGPAPEWQRAVQLFHEANDLQFQGRLAEAVEAYKRSIAAYPTAEAHTFLGWTYSWLGEYEPAMDEARKAIEIDPDYGNPYNDIGAYLTDLGRFDEAVPWLKKAMVAKRYATPHYPHLNLGEIWVHKGLWGEALGAFEEAIRLAPDQPIPPLPAFVIPPTALPKEGIRLSEEELRGVARAMARYIEAWNTYDPRALLEASVPASLGLTRVLLLHLARAKLEGTQLRPLDMEVLYFSEGVAVVRTLFEMGRVRAAVGHLLAQEDGQWRVAGLALVGHAEGGPAGPLNRLAPCPSLGGPALSDLCQGSGSGIGS